MSIAAPRQIRARSKTGRQKAGHVFKLLRIKGFEPFDPIKLPYAQERVRHEDGSWTDVQLRTDLRGVPIQRQTVDGVLCDVTWWCGPASDRPCLGCSMADGKSRNVIRSSRPAKVMGDNRVPTFRDAGFWHVGCLTVKLANHGRNGHDTRQVSSKLVVSK